MEIVTRKDAISKGLAKYFTGNPCRNGHMAPRYTQSSTCEDCIRASRSLSVISTQGQILAPERLEMQKSQISLESQKLAIKVQRVELEKVRLQYQLEGRRERQMKEQRKATVKSQLIEAFVFIDPLDYARVTTSIWGFAIMRDPMLRKEDVIPGREMKDCRFVVKCFPEDQAEILKFTGAIWAARNAKVIEDKRQSVALELTALAESSVDWPEGDPT